MLALSICLAVVLLRLQATSRELLQKFKPNPSENPRNIGSRRFPKRNGIARKLKDINEPREAKSISPELFLGEIISPARAKPIERWNRISPILSIPLKFAEDASNRNANTNVSANWRITEIIR